MLGRECWLELASGERIGLPIERWRSAPGNGDELLLRNCVGPTVDIGCGPGRLTAALVARGVTVLGVDVSSVAVGLTRKAGGPAIRRDVFQRLPGEGRWRHALLADGNIGIGGDPVRLLRRVGQLLAPGGTVLVEVDEPGAGLRRHRVRVVPADTMLADVHEPETQQRPHQIGVGPAETMPDEPQANPRQRQVRQVPADTTPVDAHQPGTEIRPHQTRAAPAETTPDEPQANPRQRQVRQVPADTTPVDAHQPGAELRPHQTRTARADASPDELEAGLRRHRVGVVSAEIMPVDRREPGAGLRHRVAQVGWWTGAEMGTRGRWFDWAWLGADAIEEIGRRGGLVTCWVRERGGRWFAELVRP